MISKAPTSSPFSLALKMRELGLFSLEKRRVWGDLVAGFQYLKGAYKKGGGGLFTRAWCDRTRGNDLKLKEGRLNMRNKFFTMRVVRQRNRLPREIVECPLPGNVQGQVGRGFEQPVLVEGVPAHGRGVITRWSLRSLPIQTIL